MFFPLLKGFGAGGSLIVAIGAQNAFVIRQGLKREHLFLTAIICSLIDAVLITLGIMGFGNVIVFYPSLIDVTKYLAVAFLIIYGGLSLRSAFKKSSLRIDKDLGESSSAKATAFSLVALSLLNPHAYLDTVVLLGSIASQHQEHELIFFAMGAIIASFTWFFGITYGAYLLAPAFQKENAWKIIDITVAIMMWGIALTLLHIL